MNRAGALLTLSLVPLFSVAGGSARGPAHATGNVELEVVRQCPRPVLTIHTLGAQGNKYGFEGGRVVKLGSTYHLFTSEMFGDPHWVKMRLAHWTSPDRANWQRVATLFESSGDFTGKDPRAALWSPMPVFDPKANRWNLFYVAYAASPDTSQAWLTNHEGRIWRAVSEQPGRDGIDGPWKDAGIVLERGANSDSWEGLQGTDSFFPYRVGDRWYALYGSAHTESLPISLWQVGLASAPELRGPWTRCTDFNPLRVEPRFIENPIVTRLADGMYLAVYDNHVANEIGYTVSADGIHWSGRPAPGGAERQPCLGDGSPHAAGHGGGRRQLFYAVLYRQRKDRGRACRRIRGQPHAGRPWICRSTPADRPRGDEPLADPDGA